MFIFAQKHRFKRARILAGAIMGGYLCVLTACLTSSAAAAEPAELDFSKLESEQYSDIFNSNLYYDFADYLSFSTLYRKVTRRKAVAANVNIYDEVPDSTFYTNRHGRARLSNEALARGAATGNGPDLSGSLTVLYATSEGLHPGLYARDKKGDVYLFKFDPSDNLELATAAEMIASRFYYAFGYNVSGSYLAHVDPSQFVPSEGAKFYDHTGFKKPLTQDALQELLLFVPYTDDGDLRASAIQVLDGSVQGHVGLRGRHRDDPDDLVKHENRRELRALRVFSSWLNNYDVRRGHTLQVLTEETGKTQIKNYIVDYNASLGAGTHDAKPPMFTHEYLFDYGEAAKAYLSGGFWEKPWQKRWKEANETVGSAAVGYFDNRYFDPGKYKVQLPARAFKNLTPADAFWAAKTIMSFTDEDVRTIVKTGQYSHPEDEETVARVLIERRDLIGQYWFSRVSPLDAVDVEGNKLVFTDLAVLYGFEKADQTTYRTQVSAVKNGKKTDLTATENAEPAVVLDPVWLETADSLSFSIQAVRNDQAPSPAVTVQVGPDGIQGIAH